MFLNLHHKASAQRDTLFYIGDPMCSWCYGFSPQLDSVMAQFPNMPVSLILGGLRAYGTESFESLSSFLHEHWQEVQNRTNQPFQFNILNAKGLVYDTEPACRAVVSMRSISPQKEYTYFKSLQKAFYEEGRDPTSVKTFSDLAASLGVDGEKFEKHFLSPVIQNETQRDFQMAKTLHVQGFPSLVALIDGKLHRISNGYLSAGQIISTLISLGFDEE